MSGRKFSGAVFKKHIEGDTNAVPITVKGGVNVVLGEGELSGEVDPSRLHVSGDARVVTVRVDTSASVESPIGSAQGSGYAQGPSAEASGEVGIDRLGGKIGVGAG